MLSRHGQPRQIRGAEQQRRHFVKGQVTRDGAVVHGVRVFNGIGIRAQAALHGLEALRIEARLVCRPRPRWRFDCDSLRRSRY